MGSDTTRWHAAFVAVAMLLLAVLAVSSPTTRPAATGPSGGVVIGVAARGDVALAHLPTSTAHLVAKPVNRLPWAPAAPVRWSALLLVLLTTLTFGSVTVARRSWRWCPFAWRAPPVSAVA